MQQSPDQVVAREGRPAEGDSSPNRSSDVPLLEVKSLTVHFQTYDGTSRVVEDVSLSVRPGERVGLVGETGCGKSVTVKTIMGLLPMPPARIVSGEVRFQGRDLLALPRREWRRARQEMAMIFQQPMTSLNPVFTIGDQMRAVLRVDPVWRRSRREALNARCREALQKVQLPDQARILDSYPMQLSGGMRQRVLIALALLKEPKLLVADEPGTALDVTVQAEVLDLLDHLVREEGLAVLHITHNLGVVRETTDRVCVMYAGHVVEETPTADLFSRPRHPYTRGLIDSVPHLSGKGIGPGIDGTLPSYTTPPVGCRFHPRCAYADDACSENPSLRHLGDGHYASCHHVEQVAKEANAGV